MNWLAQWNLGRYLYFKLFPSRIVFNNTTIKDSCRAQRWAKASTSEAVANIDKLIENYSSIASSLRSERARREREQIIWEKWKSAITSTLAAWRVSKLIPADQQQLVAEAKFEIEIPAKGHWKKLEPSFGYASYCIFSAKISAPTNLQSRAKQPQRLPLDCYYFLSLTDWQTEIARQTHRQTTESWVEQLLVECNLTAAAAKRAPDLRAQAQWVAVCVFLAG